MTRNEKLLGAAGLAGTAIVAGIIGSEFGPVKMVTNADTGGSPMPTGSPEVSPITSAMPSQSQEIPLPSGSGTIVFPSASPIESQAPSAVPSMGAENLPQVAQMLVIPEPQKVSGDLVRSFISGGKFPQYQEGQWFLPAYDEFEANAKFDWRGIGPWCPVAFRELQSGAAHLTTHGAVGETVIVADQGGWVEFGVMQLGKHQNDGLMNGTGQVDNNWKMQYTFKGLEPGQAIIPVDPDTGKPLTWDGTTPIVYTASKFGDFSVELPKTDANHDVKVAFVFNLGASAQGEQAHEIKIERGPNDHPELKGENVLPSSVIKPAVQS